MLLLVAIVLQSCLLNDIATAARAEFFDLALKMPTRQITTAGRRNSLNPVSSHPSCSQTTKVQKAWWQVDIGQNYHIIAVALTNDRGKSTGE